MKSQKITIYKGEFQSLFYWMVRSKRHAYGRLGEPGRFQSLFYWMVRSKLVERSNKDADTIKFQSLFYWMVRSKKSVASPFTMDD